MERLPLQGVRIADFTRVLTGPYCTQTLGDFGADVVKVEPPAGDDTRAWGPPYQTGTSEATYFQSANRNKRSLVLDLKNPADLELAKGLIAASDVLIENFRPGTLERLGLGVEALRTAHPRLIVCSITGFGASGPLAHWAGYDLIAQGMGGFMAYTGEADGPNGAGRPTKAGVAVADVFAGALACQAILAALFERESSGCGRRIEINLLEAMLALGTYQVQRFLGATENAERLGNEHRSIVPYGMYRTLDGFINIAVGNDALYVKLCAALQSENLRQERYATNAQRVALRAELIPQLEAQLARFSSAEAIGLLQAAGVPCGPVWSVAEALESDFVRQRAVVAEVLGQHGSVKVLTPPFEFDGERLPVRLAPPALDQHGVSLRQELERNQRTP